MRWQCRLEGGPYDGDAGAWAAEKLPPRFSVFRCPDCKDIHWSDATIRNSEPYDFDRMEDSGTHGNVAVYVHADIDLSDLPTIECHELTTA